MKIINDTIHGQFKLNGVCQELLKTPEMNKRSTPTTPSPMCISCNSKQVHELTKKLTLRSERD